MVRSNQLKGVDNLATTKNITMKQFNGTDYDTLYPKTVAAQIDDVYSKSETYSKNDVYTKSQVYDKTQTLADATKTMYGLGSTATPNHIGKHCIRLCPIELN